MKCDVELSELGCKIREQCCASIDAECAGFLLLIVLVIYKKEGIVNKRQQRVGSSALIKESLFVVNNKSQAGI